MDDEYFILHRYFLNADLMKEKYVSLIKNKEHETDIGRQQAMHLQNLWYSLLYVVIEGYQVNVKEKEAEIDAIIAKHEDLIDSMRKLRNKVFHAQEKYFHKQEKEFSKTS